MSLYIKDAINTIITELGNNVEVKSCGLHAILEYNGTTLYVDIFDGEPEYRVARDMFFGIGITRKYSTLQSAISAAKKYGKRLKK